MSTSYTLLFTYIRDKFVLARIKFNLNGAIFNAKEVACFQRPLLAFIIFLLISFRLFSQLLPL